MIMKNQKLSNVSRLLVAFASAALIAVYWLPVWRIDLFAPQYPEGLTMNIWIYTLTGQVDVINGLNHYIGMKHIEPAMFPEFGYLPYVVAAFMLLGFVTAITGSRKLLFVFLLLSIAGGILALYDFYSWGYDYGHDLDPKAPIQVPGLSYQPPLLGHKRLLNFDAYSFPDAGGWIVIAAGALAAAVWAGEWFRHRKKAGKTSPAKVLSVTCLLGMTVLASCSTQPTPFDTGKDACHFCKMSITDTRFGGELITKKGKVFKFDDLHCLAAFLRSDAVPEKEIARTLTINFEAPNTFLDVDQAAFVTDPALKSPMGSHAAGFSGRQVATAFIEGRPAARVIGWPALRDTLTD